MKMEVFQKWTLWAIIVILTVSPICSGAQGSLREIRSTACSATFITPDHLGNVYTLEGSTLSSRDSLGKVLYTYSNLNSGLFTSVDATDPLKLLLFCREFSTLRMLDQKLSIQGSELNLLDLTDGNISLACTSYESGFWLYDATNVRLLRFDSKAELAQTSGNLNMETGMELNPHFVVESGYQVYLCDSLRGLFLFDRFGTYLKNLPFYHVMSLQVSGDILYLMTPGKIIAYNTSNKAQTEIIPPVPFLSGCISAGRLYLLTGKALNIFQL